MELTKTDLQGTAIGYVEKMDIDFEVGEDESDSINDFQLEMKRWNWDESMKYGIRVYADGTEFGGIVREISTDSSANVIRAKGYTWRGMLTKKIIEPLSGEDYATATGELNAVVKDMVEKAFPGLFCGVDIDTGVKVTNYQFERYCSLHSGLKKMLESVGYRLDIKYKEEGKTGHVYVGAVPIQDMSSEYEFTNDNNMSFTTDDNRRGVNHLICLGKGELKDRIVVHLYVDNNGKISQTQYYTGADEITETYDNNGVEEDELLKNGTKELESRKDNKTYNMKIVKIEENLEVGDIVGGKDYLTGISAKKPIARKVWTVSSGKEKIDYKLKGES